MIMLNVRKVLTLVILIEIFIINTFLKNSIIIIFIIL